MSLSKNIKHCRRCISVPIRHFTGSSNAVEPPKMSSRAMSLTQWKVINYLKDCISKVTTDKTFQSSLNKEFAQLLQRFQPSVYGSEIIRYFDSATVDPSAISKNNVKSDIKKSESSLSNAYNGLKIKIGMEEAPQPKEVIPKWKTEISTVSKSSVVSRTRQVLSCIMTAETTESKLKRIEDLSIHIQQYPEAKTYAVKDGAIRLLLRIRAQTVDKELHGVINEAFALLGHTDPLPGNGIRILSIDGGGVRGLLVIEMLKKLEELTGKRVYEMFDYICGVSTGAILACTLGVLQKTCDELHEDYINISTKVFTQSALKGTSSLVWTHSYYDTDLWETLLRKQVGEGSLISSNRQPRCPKVSTVSAVVNHARVSAYVFRNYSLPWRVRSQYMGGNNHKVWEATRASAAAPTYFEECRLGNLLHQDGGILFNNPTAVAVHEAKLLWPGSPIQCVVSFGTGRTIPNPSEIASDEKSESTTASFSSWKNKFMKILESATDTEGVHTMLSDLLPENKYFRFNPYLTEMLSMAEIEPKKIEQLERDAVMYLRKNEDKFQQAAKALMEPRSLTQKAVDYYLLKKEILGLSSKL